VRGSRIVEAISSERDEPSYPISPDSPPDFSFPRGDIPQLSVPGAQRARYRPSQ